LQEIWNFASKHYWEKIKTRCLELIDSRYKNEGLSEMTTEMATDLVSLVASGEDDRLNGRKDVYGELHAWGINV